MAGTFWFRVLVFLLKALPGLIAGFQLGYMQAAAPAEPVAYMMSTPSFFYPLFWIAVGCFIWHMLNAAQAAGFGGIRTMLYNMAVKVVRGIMQLIEAAKV